MPKGQVQKEFKEEYTQKVNAFLTSANDWESRALIEKEALLVEIIKTPDGRPMVRVRTDNVKNALKLVNQRHMDAFIELAKAIAENENNIRDKLEVLREFLPEGRSKRRVEEL